MPTVAINGLGRIGRAALKIVLDADGLDLVAINSPSGRPRFVSCASCTTNCITPVIEVANRRFGVDRAVMTTVHAYTAGQQLVDGPSRHFRRGRAAAANLVPTSTGAAQATARAVPELAGRFDGIAVRAPVPVGSIADIVFIAGRPTTTAAVNEAFRQEAVSARYDGILGVSDDALVSADIIGDTRDPRLFRTSSVGGALPRWPGSGPSHRRGCRTPHHPATRK